MRIHTAVLLFAPLVLGCGARTELSGEDLDSSLSEDAPAQDGWSNDSSVQDATLDVKPDVQHDASVDDADAEPPKECAPDCTSNFECEITCPSLPHGRYCCDAIIGICYAFSGHHCPPVLDAGFD